MAITQKNNKISSKRIEEFRGQLLGWYDKHRRILPWRAPKGQKADPYHVWLSEIMLQQTTVTTVKPYFEKFLAKWPTVEDLASAQQEEVMHEWAGLGYYARARNLHKCAQVVANDLGGVFPDEQVELKKLPGVGDYTSAAVSTIAFNKPATVVDGNVERVMARYFSVEEPLPKSKPQLKSLAHHFFEGYIDRPGDLAQALMDLGAGICIPKAPRCSLCPVSDGCRATALGIAERLPKKSNKKPKPKKIGHVYWVENDSGEILLHRRSEKGLLGGMVGLPTSEWLAREDKEKLKPPDFLESFRDIGQKPVSIYHVFTHFELELILMSAKCGFIPNNDEGYFWKKAPDLQDSGLPSLFDKALRHFNTMLPQVEE